MVLVVGDSHDHGYDHPDFDPNWRNHESQLPVGPIEPLPPNTQRVFQDDLRNDSQLLTSKRKQQTMNAPIIKNAVDITDPWTRWFLYGPTGAGKTHAAGTFPKPFFIVPPNEKSIVTLAGADIAYTEVSNRQEMHAALRWLREQYDQAMALYAAGEDDEAEELFPYQTIVVESLSHYCELLVEDIGKRGQAKMDQQSWGQLSSHLRTLHSQLSDMDVHVVYTSLAKTDEAGNGQPLMIGKNAIMMPSACDIIGYCESVPVQRGKAPVHRIHFRQFGRFPARSRFRGFPDMVENFSFDAVQDSLRPRRQSA